MNLTKYPTNKNKIFLYNGYVIWLNFIIALPFSILVLVHPLLYFTIKGIIITIGFCSIVFGDKIYNVFRNFYRFHTGKPSLEITDKYYIDHTINKKIELKNIKGISINYRESKEFLEFELFDNMIYYEQVQNPIARYFKKVLVSKEVILTELSLIKGKNRTIFEEVFTCVVLKSN